MKSIIPRDDPNRCYLCGSVGQMHLHHILHGSNRKQADKYGVTVHLCPNCHMRLHDEEKHPGDLFLKRTAEKIFTVKYGHEKWMEVFGKSFLLKLEDLEHEDWMDGFWD